MKHLRTEIHITVACYIGEDVGVDKLPLSRSPNAVDAVSLTRVHQVPHDGSPGDIAADQIESLLESANNHLGAQLSHQLRKS
jgi:hypothetical protein